MRRFSKRLTFHAQCYQKFDRVAKSMAKQLSVPSPAFPSPESWAINRRRWSVRRGVIAGLTRYANKGHIARAVLEATAFQTREVVEAMEKDSRIELASLRVDGGMVANELLMQFQADVLDREVVRPVIQETTALGAAYAAGLAVKFFSGLEELRANWAVDRTWKPHLAEKEREKLYRQWKKAVTRSFDWMES